jgi:hypothetical protein
LTFTEVKSGYALLGYNEITDRNRNVCVFEISADLTCCDRRLFGSATGGHNTLRVNDDLVFTGYGNEYGDDRRLYPAKVNFN